MRENLELIAGIYGQSKRCAAASARHAIEEFGLSEVTSRRARTLSGGMQCRLSLAMALITNQPIMFLDGPTVSLDVFARRELWDVITSLKGKVTILLTTHYREEVERLADVVAIMVSGTVVATGTVDDLERRSKTDTLEDAFVRFAGGAR